MFGSIELHYQVQQQSTCYITVSCKNRFFIEVEIIPEVLNVLDLPYPDKTVLLNFLELDY